MPSNAQEIIYFINGLKLGTLLTDPLPSHNNNSFKGSTTLVTAKRKQKQAVGVMVIERMPAQQKLSILVNTNRETVSRAKQVLIQVSYWRKNSEG